MHISQLNDCKHGISGHSLITGQAWHFEIPVHLRCWALLNSLEHFANYIQLGFKVAMAGILSSSVILNGTVSNTGAGWLHHLSLDNSKPSCTQSLGHLCAVAQLLINHSSILFLKWFWGKENQEANSLSPYHHITNNALCPLLHFSFPK
jgi:Zn-dependent protease